MLVALVAVLVSAVVFVPAASARRGAAQLTVFAAASLNPVLTQIDPSEKYSFAGSDALQAQIALGAPADVFLAASAVGPDALYAAGKCQKPVIFVRNRLVLAVPASNPADITSVYDLKRAGVRVLIGTPTVPIGSYTRQILRNVGLLNAITPQVVSQEKDVATIAAKLKLGAADAGFVYVTDALSAGPALKALPLPTWAQPPVKYEGCVVTASADQASAEAFLKRLSTKPVQAQLTAAGFLLPKVPAKPVNPVTKKK
ncbi:MAG: molybdate transport system substrate-binding protein [Gaiellales bacterium]|jgi:molybdate transport system substrate-binding protein|nr:molybdate transport system substrate-binding protein [Gaiellales bacterium]